MNSNVQYSEKNNVAPWINFFASQKLLMLATTDGQEVWLSNVFYAFYTDQWDIYFISAKEAKHSQHILVNPQVSFSIAWYDSSDYTNRKGIQAKGLCYITHDPDEIEKGVRSHNERFPDFKKRITPEWIMQSDNTSCLWVIKSTYIKYWDDELFGQDGIQEFYYKQ